MDYDVALSHRLADDRSAHDTSPMEGVDVRVV